MICTLLAVHLRKQELEAVLAEEVEMKARIEITKALGITTSAARQAMLSSPRRPSSTIRIFSSAEKPPARLSSNLRAGAGCPPPRMVLRPATSTVSVPPNLSYEKKSGDERDTTGARYDVVNCVVDESGLCTCAEYRYVDPTCLGNEAYRIRIHAKHRNARHDSSDIEQSERRHRAKVSDRLSSGRRGCSRQNRG